MSNATRLDTPDIDPADIPIISSAVTCPFTVVYDSREQAPYQFIGLTTGGKLLRPLVVPTMRAAMKTADYSIFGMPSIAIERKEKSDLFSSVVKRANFIGRLERMSELACAAVVVEAEISSILRDPPPFTKYRPKSLMRTILAWTVRYPTVHWWFMPGRDAAEALTFRLLERFWLDRTKEQQS